MFSVSSCFIQTFKIGDNINHNLKIVRTLYELSEGDHSVRVILRKPIIVTLVSVAEAMLYDFISRIQSAERIATLPANTVYALRDKKYKELTTLISGARKHDLFNTGDEFYDQLDELRKLRNRVHIQNEKNHFERDEPHAFSAQRQRDAESVVEYVAKFLSINHPRATGLHGYVNDLEFPWTERWDFGT